VQQLRRWVPGPARKAVAAVTPAVAERSEEPSLKDLAFCSELAFHGGVAVSEKGFKAETELVRMRQVGLLDLQRGAVPPFAVTRVALSAKAHELLSGRGQAFAAGRGKVATESAVGKPASGLDLKQERHLRRNGFEVARGMISAAVKTELASWTAASKPGGISGLEARILTRISQIEVPFPA
jgi:hypothetical protein